MRTSTFSPTLANIRIKMENILSKYHKYLLIIALILSSIAISIRGSDGEVRLVFNNYPALITLLITVSLILVAIYFNINSKKISELSNQIKEQSQSKDDRINDLIEGLTERQREVYDLILLGMTNKEIMSKLFIEQSTLKSHINQIYKKLNIKSRRDLKSKINT
jgi:DNA-binding CsgD family transcriptional regulator